MRHRSYFTLPDVRRTREVLNLLVAAGIAERDIHVLARPGSLPADLGQHSLLQSTDPVFGSWAAALPGILAALLAALLMWAVPLLGVQLQPFGLVLCAAAAAGSGAWMASQSGILVSGGRLEPYLDAIGQGQILMMVDVAAKYLPQIRALTEGVAESGAFAGPSVEVYFGHARDPMSVTGSLR